MGLPSRFCGVGIVVAAAVVLGGVPPASAAPTPKELGFNVHQSATTGMDVAVLAGTKWVRVDFNWLDAEPTAQGQYDWGRFDAIVAAADAKGLKILAVIGYTPAWASQGNTKGDGSTNDVPKAGTYAPFATAVVNRYKAKISHWEIWNEPNLDHFFEGTPQQYIDRILIPGADAVHAACPACKVLAPGLATVGGEYATWLDSVLAQAASKIDIVSGHVYHEFPKPGDGTGLTSDSFQNKLESHRVVKLGAATVYEGPLSFKEVMDKHAVAKPFWLTETGREATQGNASEEEAQRVYYRQVLELMQNRPWWTGTMFYEGFDEPPAPYRWGVVVHDESQPSKMRAKSALGFLKRVTSSQPVYGGTKTDCDDGLDNDLDGTIDFPADKTCTSLAGTSEGAPPPPDPDAGAVTPDGGASSSGGASSGGASSSGASSGGVASSGTSGDAVSPNDGGPDGGCTTSTSSTTSSAPWATIAVALAALASLRIRRRAARPTPASRGAR